MPDYVISVDPGNGMTNAVRSMKKGYKAIAFPSVRAAATGDTLGIGGQFELDYEYIDWGSHRYIVGDDVSISRRAVERHQGAFRYGDEFWLFLVATAIAKLGVTKGTVDLTVFAPPGMYFDARHAIEERFKKNKGLILIKLKGDSKPRQINIENVTVHPEGLGALLCFVLNDKGQPIETNLLDGQNVILDMGMNTLDALQITDGQFNPESLSSATWENGGLKTHIFDPALRVVKAVSPDFDLMTIDDVERVLRSGLTVDDWFLRVAGLEVDMKPVFDKYAERYAAWVSNNIVDGVFNGLRGIKSMILVGGGAGLIQHYLQQGYPNKILNPDAHKTMKGVSPVEMNAVGGLRLAASREFAE